MYKHECVVCSKKHGHECPLGISLFYRFFGTKEVLNCWKYQELIKKGN